MGHPSTTVPTRAGVPELVMATGRAPLSRHVQIPALLPAAPPCPLLQGGVYPQHPRWELIPVHLPNPVW